MAEAGIEFPMDRSPVNGILPLPRLALRMSLLNPWFVESKLKSFGLTLGCTTENGEFG